MRSRPDRISLRRAFPAAGTAALAMLAGYHSRFVEATIVNAGARPLTLVEVDYPSASFGVGRIAPHAQYHYRFKILGSGSVKLSYTDDKGAAHSATGPELDEGQEGSLAIAVDDAQHVQWTPS